MKKTIMSMALAMMTSVAFSADVTSTTTSTTSTGTIHEYSPGSTFIVKEESGPVRYKYGKKVTYVTKSGRELDEATVRTRVKVGAPVTVHYSGPAEERIVERVVLDDEAVDDLEDRIDDADDD
jgi:hypothetical protein